MMNTMKGGENMMEWKNPEISNLSYKETKAVPGKSGNDQWIPGGDHQGVELGIETHSGVDVGGKKKDYTRSGVINIWKDYDGTDITPALKK